MAVRSSSDFVYWLIGRLPLIAIVLAVGWILVQGLVHLEMYSFGTEFFVGNNETDNVMPMPRSDEDILSEALASGNVADMEAALDEVEARHSAAGVG